MPPGFARRGGGVAAGGARTVADEPVFYLRSVDGRSFVGGLMPHWSADLPFMGRFALLLHYAKYLFVEAKATIAPPSAEEID
jgi:hypothetical protein